MFRKSSFCHTGGCVEVEFVKSSFCGGAENCVEAGMGFVKSSASNLECVEVGAEFVKATACYETGCVEVGADYVKSSASAWDECVEVQADLDVDSSCGPEEIVVRVRDSKQNGQENQPVLEFTMSEWAAFLKGMDAGPNCEFRVVLPGISPKPEMGKSIGAACP